MNNSLVFPHTAFLLLILFAFTACSRQVSEAQPYQAQYAKSKPKAYGIDDVVLCGFEDWEGNLWFGTSREGVYRYSPSASLRAGSSAFTNFSKQNSFYSNRVSAIIEDKEGNIWFGTDDGLCNYDKRHVFNHIPIPQQDTSSSWLDKVYPIVNPNAISCLLQDSIGNLWFGTYGGGAYRYDCSSFTPFLRNEGRVQSDGLHHNVIQSMLEDSDGNIWFTSMTHGGVSRYNPSASGPDSLMHFMPEDGLSDDMVRTCMQDRQGNIWFGSLGNRAGSLDRLNAGSFTNFSEADGLCNNNTIAMHEDRKGRIWLGSGRGGLCIYDPSASLRAGGETFSEFIYEGQHFHGISFIMEDTPGNIWFGGQHGQLFRYDGEVLTDFTQKKAAAK